MKRNGKQFLIRSLIIFYVKRERKEHLRENIGIIRRKESTCAQDVDCLCFLLKPSLIPEQGGLAFMRLWNPTICSKPLIIHLGWFVRKLFVHVVMVIWGMFLKMVPILRD